ncbi:paralemmin-3 isoform X1 [Peromyscus californicus insignis]|uniref:paralemmin-3 isoform X1 n=1 Tax=Peromyscus californicus insignis TaxID=564181 RepID=UPI0022A771DB|nr:paralemmin-3 isoform X1 [Peromyscus californicus insignis]
MDGAAEGPERPEDLASKDPQSPEGQAQARIRNLEDSLFSLQSQLQLLQSASTGAQHRPAGRPSWRREGPRPLSQPTMEACPAGLTDVDKRTSLPAGPVGMSPESPSDPRKELIEVLPALRPSPEATEASPEANGPCPEHSPLPEQLSLGAASVTKAKGDGVVEVDWAGLRATENSATDPTGMELEAKVEEVVLEAIGARQGTSSPELPTWVKESRGVVEVVWEGLGGSDPDVTGESGRNAEATQISSPRLQEQVEAEISRKEEGASRDSPEGAGQGDPGGEEGSFIWVERAALSEDWEELLMEGLEAPPGAGCVGGREALMGAQPRGSEESWEVERREVEKSEGMEERAMAEKLGAERGGAAEVPEPAQGREESQAEKGDKGSQGPLQAERAAEEEQWAVKGKESEEALEVKTGGEEEPDTTEKPLAAEKKTEGPLEPERKGSEPPSAEERDGGSSLDRESKTSEELLEGEPGGEEQLAEAEKTPGAKEEVSPGEQGRSNEGAGFRVEDASQPGTPLCVQEEPTSEEQGLQGLEKQEGPVEETAREPQPCAESEDPPGDATPLLSETPAPEQPVEGQALLHQEVSSTNPGDHPAPTYAPARQLEVAEAKEAGGPKQKTCQCCVVM